MGNLFDQSRDKSRVSRQNLILKAFYEATSSPFRVPLMLTLFTFHSIRKGSYHAVSFSIGSRQFAERHEKIASSKENFLWAYWMRSGR